MARTSKAKPTAGRGALGRRSSRIALGIVIPLALLLNAMAFSEAWSMSHYKYNAQRPHYAHLTSWETTELLLSGPTVPRMRNVYTPERFNLNYEHDRFPGYKGIALDAWRIPSRNPAAPIVLLFPGYGGSKDTLLQAASEFHWLGCEAWPVDFHGNGDSADCSVSFGYNEAEDVAAAERHARALAPGRPIILYGVSMGSASIYCAIHRGLAHPDAIITECPFDRFLVTAENRYRKLGVPPIPLAPLTVFWLGAQQHFDAFSLNPVCYASEVRCPALVMEGANDEMVPMDHARQIARALGSHGAFALFEHGAHTYLIRSDVQYWRKSVGTFLERNGFDVENSETRDSGEHREPQSE